MKLVGLTGGAGSGKSTVAAMLRDLGAVVVDADEATHAVYEPGTPGFEAVVKEFGKDYVKEGRIDRKRLGELVVNDASARRRSSTSRSRCRSSALSQVAVSRMSKRTL